MEQAVPNDPIVRIYFRDASGTIVDPLLDLSIDAFAGHLPSVGDIIVDPHISLGVAQQQSSQGEQWTVVSRVFNPKDQRGIVALVVEKDEPEIDKPWV